MTKKINYLKTIGSTLIVGAFLFLAYGSSESDSNSKSEPRKQINCVDCSKDLTNDYNRISPNFNDNYFCTPCYRKTMKEINHELELEGY